MEVLKTRRSVRKYDQSKPIDYETLIELCRCGEYAPAARNQKGREYVIVDDKEVINKLSNVSKGAKVLEGAVAAIVVVARNKETLVTPDMLEQDLGCSVENILIAATYMGIGSCYIGIHPHPDRVGPCDEILNVKDGKHTFAIISLGFPSEDNAFYVREKLTDDMIYHNGY